MGYGAPSGSALESGFGTDASDVDAGVALGPPDDVDEDDELAGAPSGEPMSSEPQAAIESGSRSARPAKRSEDGSISVAP